MEYGGLPNSPSLVPGKLALCRGAYCADTHIMAIGNPVRAKENKTFPRAEHVLEPGLVSKVVFGLAHRAKEVL